MREWESGDVLETTYGEWQEALSDDALTETDFHLY